MNPTPRQRFEAAIDQPDAAIDLVAAALCIAQETYPDRDLSPCLEQLDAIAATIAPRLPAERYPLRWIQIINQHLFQDLGFRGNTDNYYDPRNSFLNDVLERRTGIPISLSLVYGAVAQRLGFPLEGIGMPGHFLLRPQVDAMELYVDAFHQGEVLFPQDCEARLQQIYGMPVSLKAEHLEPVSQRQFLARLLTNLKVIYIKTGAFTQALAMVDWLLLLHPDRPQDHRDRGLLLYELQRWQEAYPELTLYVQYQEAQGLAGNQAQDLPVIRRLLETLRSAL
ncbi:SirB1 family protein [Prochlorothrix hollandica]|uniref:Protein SirB1 N-terminal domain-containing protein n=1 Tax=Prochlorothrix hollandica PCC 9006 = CALU 1027 TaxID=317619 RepID=A0A0M2PP27_PROHO|nr:transglutaminase-like domain-containing protein [Prochlorothrix hollandica]KKI98029.1 hypothetical protein PROH_19975 [Prochlorothrix hollandica PCC 9006 = CALU 1027]